RRRDQRRADGETGAALQDLAASEASPGLFHATHCHPPLFRARCTFVEPFESKKQASPESKTTPVWEPMGAEKPRPARAVSRSSPIRTSTRVSLPMGSTT